MIYCIPLVASDLKLRANNHDNLLAATEVHNLILQVCYLSTQVQC